MTQNKLLQNRNIFSFLTEFIVSAHVPHIRRDWLYLLGLVLTVDTKVRTAGQTIFNLIFN